MPTIGLPVPPTPRKTILTETEDSWYQQFLSEKLNRPISPVKRSNFGQYDMAVNYLTSVLEEAAAIRNVAVYNIDHMAQIEFSGKDALALLDRVLPADIASLKIGQCKYTLLLSDQGTVLDDLIAMRLAEESFLLVINAGHDLTGIVDEHGITRNAVSDADHIMKYLQPGEDVCVRDISDQYVKIDIQGPLSFKLIAGIYGPDVLKNRNTPEKNMNFFTFNEFDFEGHHYLISRTGYTNRWGWEVYIPAAVAIEQFKKIVTRAYDLGGLLVGLGGRDENRISAGNVGLPLMGQEYDPAHTPINSPLFDAAIDMNKPGFAGKEVLVSERANHPTKQMVLVISEGIVVGKGVYRDGIRLGSCTSSINSPNVSLAKRQLIGSSRKSVQDGNGVAAIGLCWLYRSPYESNANGEPILEIDGTPVPIPVEFYREEEGKPVGKPTLGYIAADGVNPATAPKPLKQIENL